MKFRRLKVLPIQFFPVASSVIFLPVYAKCNFVSVLKFLADFVVLLCQLELLSAYFPVTRVVFLSFM